MGQHTRRNQLRRKRHKARSKHLDAMYAFQHSLCHWCKSATAIVGNIPVESVLRLDNGCVVWRDGNEYFRARIATVDHVVPLRDNGSNERENLVMSCAGCNQSRTRQRSPKDGIRRVCSCGASKVRKRSLCLACYTDGAREYLAQHGWEETPGDTPQHSRFRDPVDGSLHILRHACRIQKHRSGEENQYGE